MPFDITVLRHVFTILMLVRWFLYIEPVHRILSLVFHAIFEYMYLPSFIADLIGLKLQSLFYLSEPVFNSLLRRS